MKKIFFIAIAITALSACNNNAEKTGSTTTISNPTTTATDTSHHLMPAAIYQCPMDTEVTSDKPGTCPKCGMDLELKK